MLDAIDAADLEVHEMANNVFDGDEAAIVKIELHQLPTDALVDSLSHDDPITADAESNAA